MSRATRAWLGGLSSTNALLDRECWLLIQPILDRTREVHPGGLVVAAARGLGASENRALLAGSICELFYAGCSVTDDLQDGDTDAYLGDVPPALRVNAQVQLLSLVAVRLHELALGVEPVLGRELMLEPYRTLAIMLTGQRLELTREPWDLAAYERVARLSAGEQFGTYLRIATVAADADAEPWVSYGRALGMLLQIVTDDETDDLRLRCLPREEVIDLARRLVSELSQPAAPSDMLLRDQLTQGVVRRCQLMHQRC